MIGLNPYSDKDRRITAVTRSFPIEVFPNGDVLQGTYSYDCWGRIQGGLFKQRVSAEYAKKTTGQKSHLTLELMQRGCCPPQLAGEILSDAGAPEAKGGDVEEAYKLHKRGYLGGVG